MTETAEELRRQAAELVARADQLGASQLTRDDLAGMSPAAINAAREAGRLQVLLGADPEEVALTTRARAGRIDVDDIKQLAAAGHHELISAARADDRIDYPNTPGA